MRTLGVILLSVGLNVALLFMNVAAFRTPAPPVIPAPVVARVVTNTAWRVERRPEPAPPAPATNAPPPLPFSWAEIESAEYPTYIANLRKFGCPEITIQDIIIADVRKLYEGRIRASRSPADDTFWQSGSAMLARTRAREARVRALEEERNQLLQQLLGIDPLADRRVWEERDGPDLADVERLVFFPQLAPAKREALQMLLAHNRRDGRHRRTPEERAGFQLDPDDEHRSQAALVAEVRKVLTADEIKEINARVAGVDLRFSGMEVSPAEARAIAVLKARETGAEFLTIEQSFGRAEKASEGDADMEIQKMLGTRWADYERAQDSRFEEIYEFASTNGLPRTTSIRAYDIQVAAEDAANKIRTDDSLAPDAAAKLLRDLRATTEAKLRLELGADLGAKYAKENQDGWLKTIGEVSENRPLGR